MRLFLSFFALMLQVGRSRANFAELQSLFSDSEPASKDAGKSSYPRTRAASANEGNNGARQAASMGIEEAFPGEEPPLSSYQ